MSFNLVVNNDSVYISKLTFRYRFILCKLGDHRVTDVGVYSPDCHYAAKPSVNRCHLPN